MVLVFARQSRIFQHLMLTWAARCAGSWEGKQPGQLATTDQRDVPYHMMSAQHIKLGEEEGKGGHLE